MYYIGTWDDPVAALREYLSIKDSLQAGIDPQKLRSFSHHPAQYFNQSVDLLRSVVQMT